MRGLRRARVGDRFHRFGALPRSKQEGQKDWRNSKRGKLQKTFISYQKHEVFILLQKAVNFVTSKSDLGTLLGKPAKYNARRVSAGERFE